MDRWKGRVALVTGASGGIGAEISKSLGRAGMKVVGAARRVHKIEELSEELKDEPGSLFGIKCDLTKENDVYALFDIIKEKFGGVDLCINNAGTFLHNSLMNGTPEEWRLVMDLNVIAACLCTKLSITSMRERCVEDGQIINLSAECGHEVSSLKFLHFYSASKFALKALTEGFRQELKGLKSHIRISDISPGIVRTNILDINPSKRDEVYGKGTPLEVEDIAASVLYLLSVPTRVEINDIYMKPTCFPAFPTISQEASK